MRFFSRIFVNSAMPHHDNKAAATTKLIGWPHNTNTTTDTGLRLYSSTTFICVSSSQVE